MKQTNTEAALRLFGREVIKRARFNLNLSGFARKKGRKINATKDLSRSLQSKVTKSSKGFLITFEGNDYAKFVEEGRKAGSFTPIKPLMEWIVDKGIRPQRVRVRNGQKVSEFVSMSGAQADQVIRGMAIAISKTNKEKPIPPAPFMAEALDYTYNKYKDKIADSFLDDVADLVLDTFQKNDVDGSIS